MRPQYHLRQSAEGLLAWDVFRLIELAEKQPTIELSLDSIAELDETFWYQSNTDKPSCRSVAMHSKYIDEANLKFPIILDPDGRVMDGMHRVCKALNLGLTTILATQLTNLPEPDFVNIPADQLPYED